MKKLFVALMAVLMFASCGGSNEGDGGMSPNEAADKVISINQTYNKEMAAALEADDAEMYVKAVEKYFDAVNKLAPKLEKLDENKVAPEKKKALEDLLKINDDLSRDAQLRFYSEINQGELGARFKKALGIE